MAVALTEASLIERELQVQRAIGELARATSASSKEVHRECTRILGELQKLEVCLDALAMVQPEHVVARHRREASSLRVLLRKTRLSVEAQREAEEKAAMAALLEGPGGDAGAVGKRQKLRAKRSLLRTAHAISSGMRRTRAMMAESIASSDETLGLLNQDRERLHNVGDEYDAYGVAVGEGSRAVRRIAARAWTDNVLVGLAFMFFLSTVIFVLHQRMNILAPIRLFLKPFWIILTGMLLPASADLPLDPQQHAHAHDHDHGHGHEL